MRWKVGAQGAAVAVGRSGWMLDVFEIRAGRICWWTGRVGGMREESRNRKWSSHGGDSTRDGGAL